MSNSAAYTRLTAHEYLRQWGAWLREGNAINIGRLTSQGPGGQPDGIYQEDNEHRVIAVQDVWTSLVAKSREACYSRFQRQTFRLHAFLLELEYKEGRWSRSEMVEHIVRKMRRSTYTKRSLLNNLKSAVGYMDLELGLSP